MPTHAPPKKGQVLLLHEAQWTYKTSVSAKPISRNVHRTKANTAFELSAENTVNGFTSQNTVFEFTFKNTVNSFTVFKNFPQLNQCLANILLPAQANGPSQSRLKMVE